MRNVNRFVCLLCAATALLSLRAWTLWAADVPFISVEGDVGPMDGSFESSTGEKAVADVGVLGTERRINAWSSTIHLPEDLLRAGGTATIGWKADDRWDWRLQGQVWKNLTDPNDKASSEDIVRYEESSGLYGVDAGRRTTGGQLGRTYSESDAELNAYGFDGKLEFIRRGDCGDGAVFIGHRYQKLDYDLYGLQGYRVGLSGLGLADGPLPAVPDSTRVGSYEVDSQIPYFGFGYYADVLPRLHVALSVAYSPWVQATDKNDQMVRGAKTESDTDGTALMLKGSARFDVFENVFVRLTVEYMSMDTDGDATTVVYQPTPEGALGMTFNGPTGMDERQVVVRGGIGIEL